MISGHGTVDTAVQAVKRGADDFLEKPLSLERVLLTLDKVLERRPPRTRTRWAPDASS